MTALAAGGGSSAVAASAHAGCQRFRHTDPLVTGQSRRALAAVLGAPDTSGRIPEARWARAMQFERLVRDLDVPVRVVPCPTVREQDGLALSSRNRYLTPAERRAAPHLRLALRTAAQVLRSRRNAPAAERAARAALARGGLRRIQYVSVVEPRTLRPWEGRGPARIAAAIYVGRTRLIDNRRA